jgi:hypothetical protein
LEPGGILISEKVYSQVEGKLNVGFEDRGEQQLKNISRPVRAYAVRTGTQGAAINRFGTALSLPDKPSIAVLPFQNLSSDPEQEFFADGMVEDIITALSRFKAVRYRPQLKLYLQGARGRSEADRTSAWGALRAGGQRSQGGKPGPYHGTAHRCCHRCTPLGRPV